MPKNQKKKQKPPRPAEPTDMIQSLTLRLKKQSPPSSWAILSKYDEQKFDSSIITLGQQVNNGKFASTSEVCVKLLQSLDNCFRLSVPSEHSANVMKFEKFMLSRINTTKEILFEYILNGEVFNNIFEHFQILVRRLSRSTNSVGEMQRKLSEYVSDYITVKFINADAELVKNGQRFLRDGDRVMVYSPNNIVMHFLVHMRAKGRDFTVVVVDDGDRVRNEAILQVLQEHKVKVWCILLCCYSYSMVYIGFCLVELPYTVHKIILFLCTSIKSTICVTIPGLHIYPYHLT